MEINEKNDNKKEAAVEAVDHNKNDNNDSNGNDVDMKDEEWRGKEHGHLNSQQKINERKQKLNI